jgi:hypothetical protein
MLENLLTTLKSTAGRLLESTAGVYCWSLLLVAGRYDDVPATSERAMVDGLLQESTARGWKKMMMCQPRVSGR